MAAQKRKADDSTARASKKKTKPTDTKEDFKRSRNGASPKPNASKIKTASEKPAKPTLISIVKDEERAFPRGGGGVLTPLETKQIQVQAAKDVLFEESGQKRARRETSFDSVADDVEEELDQENDEPKNKKLKVKQKKAKTKSNGLQIRNRPKKRTRVEGLKFKQITPGTLIIGRISHVADEEITLDLPNNLSGVVQSTRISREFTTGLQQLLEQQRAAEDESANDLSLKDYFVKGQYLRVYVESTLDAGDESHNTRAKKRIELSIEPGRVNATLSTTDLAVGAMLQASVSSIEDRGFVMSLDLDDVEVVGFLSPSDLPEGIEEVDVHKGSVFLCTTVALRANSKVIKLSAKIGQAAPKKAPTLPSVKALLPGALTELLVSEVSDHGIRGTIMGSLKASSDIIHCNMVANGGAPDSVFEIGQKLLVRIIFTTSEESEYHIGVSTKENLLSLSSSIDQTAATQPKSPEQLPLSTSIESAEVIFIDPSLGLFLNVGKQFVPAFVHISRISDDRVESLSDLDGRYKEGTIHRARITGFNALDGLYLASMEESILQAPFLRVEDVTVAAVVKGTVDKLMIDQQGVSGLVVNLCKGVSGFVPKHQMSEVALKKPEQKFKEGSPVTARVLSVNAERRNILLSLQKSIVNSDMKPWTSFEQIRPGEQSPGTITKFVREGAIIHFFNNVRAFLPVSEMSDAHISDPKEHFREGQVVNVQALSVNAAEQRMKVTCRIALGMEPERLEALSKLAPGQIIGGVVTDKSEDDVRLEIDTNPIKLSATLRIGQLTDGTNEKNRSSLESMRVGRKLRELVILEISPDRQLINVSTKPTLIRAAQNTTLPHDFDTLQEGQKLDGFVRNIVDFGVFVELAGGLVGLLHKRNIPDEQSQRASFGLVKDQSLSVTVMTIDASERQFTLTLKEFTKAEAADQTEDKKATEKPYQALANPIDGKSTSVADFTIGKLTVARVSSVKDTQINVQLADNVQGRIDVSEAFTDWTEIKDRKHPLKTFNAKQLIPVKVLGLHDARSHKFLPISHRGGKVPVFELSARTGLHDSILSLDQIQIGHEYTAFVNNSTRDCLWVNLSPAVRGRIERMNVTDDVAILNDLEKHYPNGSAIRVTVNNIDQDHGHLDLVVKGSSKHDITFDSLIEGSVIAGRVTKLTDRSLFIQLGREISGQIPLTEVSDDFDNVDVTKFQKNEIVRVCVLKVDKSNKRVTLSARRSKTLSSTLPVKDPSITSLSQLQINQVVRGFVKNVANIGLFVSLSPWVTAFVRVSEISDAFVKDWKSEFQVDQLIKGKITSIDHAADNVQMSTKASALDSNYVPPISFNDLSIGQVVTGKVRNVVDFGAFVDLDNSRGLSGLCHQSEMADSWVEKPSSLYSFGDKVKALIIKLDKEKHRISLSLKASNFTGREDSHEKASNDSDDAVEFEDESALSSMEELDTHIEAHGGVMVSTNVANALIDNEKPETNNEMIDANGSFDDDADGLDAGGFNWDGDISDENNDVLFTDAKAAGKESSKRKKHKKPTIQLDHTGELDRDGPQSSDDYERLILSNRDSSELWVRYMAHHLNLSEIDEARMVAERALREIVIDQQQEKLNIWVALLNLENTYGTEDSLEEMFARASASQDPQAMHEHLISIYIASGKPEKANEIFKKMLKKTTMTADPKFWINYATFLFDTLERPDEARELLGRAKQSIRDAKTLRLLIMQFARLEFKCKNGNPERGRTAFEGLFNAYENKGDIWDVLVDLERQLGEMENVRALYERMTSLERLKDVKRVRAEKIFKRWRDFEQQHGKQKNVDHVEAKRRNWEQRRQEQRQE